MNIQLLESGQKRPDCCPLKDQLTEVDLWLASGNVNFRRDPTIPRIVKSGLNYLHKRTGLHGTPAFPLGVWNTGTGQAEGSVTCPQVQLWALSCDWASLTGTVSHCWGSSTPCDPTGSVCLVCPCRSHARFPLLFCSVSSHRQKPQPQV